MVSGPKLIEVALPLAAISAASAKEKTMGARPHPQNIHRWWARRPLAAARAVIWASMVDDPSAHPDQFPAVEDQTRERERLFGILERMVPWEGSNDPEVLAEAHAEIAKCFDGDIPPVLDPFGGGGAIPLEAQRLGLTALSGDLNSVAVLIQKAMLEIPPRFGGCRPVAPGVDSELATWTGAQGLAADVEAYGEWMRDQAKERIGHLYPDATGPNGEKLTPIAWIWARTVQSPDPTWDGHVPLVASWVLARAPKKPDVWVEPVVDRDSQTISYEIREGGEPTFERTVGRGGGTCIATGAPMSLDYIKQEGQAERMGQRLMAVLAEGPNGRTYCAPTLADEGVTKEIEPPWLPSGQMSDHPQYMGTVRYGLDEWHKLFSDRQLVALTTFSDVLSEIGDKVVADAVAAGMTDDGVRLRDGGASATAYADAILTYLAFVIDKCADHWSSICGWHNSHSPQIRNVFARQAISMTWDYAEANPFSGKLASWNSMLRGLVGAISEFSGPGVTSESARVVQRDARVRVGECAPCVVSTDPPYYDAVPYSDISDFFYVWLRRNLGDVWPDECATLLTPKAEELVADNKRFDSREGAAEHFESGMGEFMTQVADAQHPDVPATIFYAYKATETKDGDVVSTGWDTFLQAILDAGMAVTATWPIRTELGNRMRSLGSNALASSIVLACRPRPSGAVLGSRGEFVAALRDELPAALEVLQQGNIAPVDLAQSAIGPGIKVFSRFARVVEADGTDMPVRRALVLINDVVSEILEGAEAEFDADTRFAFTWYSQYGYDPAPFGDADVLAKSKNTSVEGVQDAGIVTVRDGQVRLLPRTELESDWDPISDDRPTVWEGTQYLIAALQRSETEAAELLHQLGGTADSARALAYMLFAKATDKGWTDDATNYNALITVWPQLATYQPAEQQTGLF